jgi:hypothetical protein
VLNVVFAPIKKIVFIPRKRLTLTLHAAKALNKKLWYLRDQEAVVPTNPADRQTGPGKPVTRKKDHLQEGNPRQVLIEPISTNQKKNIAVSVPVKKNLFHPKTGSHGKKSKVMAINLQAVLAAVKSVRFRHAVNPIQEGRRITTPDQKAQAIVVVNQPVEKSHLHPKAGLIQGE